MYSVMVEMKDEVGFSTECWKEAGLYENIKIRRNHRDNRYLLNGYVYISISDGLSACNYIHMLCAQTLWYNIVTYN